MPQADIGKNTIDKQRDMDARIEALDSIVHRMGVVISRIRSISDRLYGQAPEGDSNEVESVPDGAMARFSRLNATGIDHVSTMEGLLTRIEEAI